MPTQNTSNLSNSQRTQYTKDYMRGADEMKLYDLYASPIADDMGEAARGSSVQVEFLTDMQPGTDTISELSDVEAQTLRDVVASVTMTSRYGLLRTSEKTILQSFTNYADEMYYKLGKHHILTVDLLAQAAALQGTFVERYVARASLDKDTAAHRLTAGAFHFIDSQLQSLFAPTYVDTTGQKIWDVIMHPRVYHDFRLSTPITEVNQYQDKSSVMAWEVGQYGRFKIHETAWAKVFGSAGADHATSVATTLNGAVNAGATTLITADDVSASIAAGRVWTLGTEETGNTFYPLNEFIRPISAVTTTITFVGEGENGGLKYDHPTGLALRNADHVYPVSFGSRSSGKPGSGSLVKVYDPATGEFGEVLDPEYDGNLKQWLQIAWKAYLGYGRVRESAIMHGEYSSSMDV